MHKPNITRTLGQIHFEYLEPHRFEGLIRQLVYDYKSWQSIEATGQDGYDIRAYEKLEITNDDKDEEGNDDVHPMQGNLWMIQCKRLVIVNLPEINTET